MDSLGIYKKVDRLIQHFGTRDPIALADDMGIAVYNVDNFTDLLGMYTYRWHHRIILMNSNVNDILYKMVVGHEIGHDQEHRSLAAGEGLREFELFNMTDMIEYEANAFASHLLIDENEMMEYFRQGYDIAAVSKLMNVNINLMLIKIQEMNKLGMDLKLPYAPDARFFRHTQY